MEINDIELERYKCKIKRQIERNKTTIKDFEDRRESLSKCGHWSLGYYIGVNSELEKLLDNIEEFKEDSKNDQC